MNGRTALSLDQNAFRLAAAREAIASLGLLVPEADGIIWHMLDLRLTDHPKHRATAYRKDGEQLTSNEKRALGLRSNAFLSRRAYNEIAKKGLSSPLRAHETVILRASFSVMRYSTIINSRNTGHSYDTYRYDVINTDCNSCRILHGTISAAEEISIFAPPECRCVTANYSFTPYVDWLADLD